MGAFGPHAIPVYINNIQKTWRLCEEKPSFSFSFYQDWVQEFWGDGTY